MQDCKISVCSNCNLWNIQVKAEIVGERRTGRRLVHDIASCCFSRDRDTGPIFRKKSQSSVADSISGCPPFSYEAWCWSWQPCTMIRQNMSVGPQPMKSTWHYKQEFRLLRFGWRRLRDVLWNAPFLYWQPNGPSVTRMSKINTYLNTASTYRKHSAEELLISDFLKFEIWILTSFGKDQVSVLYFSMVLKC